LARGDTAKSDDLWRPKWKALGREETVDATQKGDRGRRPPTLVLERGGRCCEERVSEIRVGEKHRYFQQS